MRHFEPKVFETIWPHLRVRCVDDRFAMLEKSKLDEFHKHLNTLVPEIEFKSEEKCETLSFLGVLIMRQADLSMEIAIYRKAIKTGRVLNCSKAHPKSYVRTRLYRASSTTELWKTERRKLPNSFTADGYRKGFINSCIRGSKKVEEKNNTEIIITIP